MERPLVLRESPAKRPAQTPAPRGGFLLAKPFGIEIRLDPSWILIAFLIIFSLGNEFWGRRRDLPAWSAWLAASVTGLAFFLSILLHELSHSLVARARGMTVHGITLFVFGGISQVRGEPNRPRDEFWIALVGPLTSVALGVLFSLLGKILPESSLGAMAAGWLGFVNFVLAGFNLLPGYPLDGGRIFRAAVWRMTGNLRRATRIAARLGTVIGGGLIVYGAYLIFAGLNYGAGIWVALIGWFLTSAAQRSVLNLEIRERLGRYRVRQAMGPDCPRVRADENVRRFVEEKVLGTGRRCFLVTDGDSLKGLVTLHELKSVARESWPTTTVGDVMIPLDRVESVSPSEPLARVLEKMEERGVNQIPVVEGGNLLGLVTREDVLRIMTTDLELRGSEV